MKIKIITRHFISNYGSFLQAFALQQVLYKGGFDNLIIDYQPKCENIIHYPFTSVVDTKWNSNLFMRIIYISECFFDNLFSYLKFKRTRKKFLFVTKKYSTTKELEKDFKNSNDIFITGSDQVWNYLHGKQFDYNYFLAFTNSNNKISYASSFGKSTFDNEDICKIEEYLKKYKSLLIREKSGVDLLSSVNLTSCNVLDPTLLLESNEWINIFKINKCHKKDYVFIYDLHNDKKMYSDAKKFAEKHGLKVIAPSVSITSIFKNRKYLPSIKKFMFLLYNAKYVITNSFHGTIFSINFNKEFITYLPGLSNSRIISILDVLNLKSRIACDLNDIEKIYSENIDYDSINKELLKLRDDSKNKLYDSIEKLR